MVTWLPSAVRTGILINATLLGHYNGHATPPLHVAARYNADAIPMLLQKGANVNAKNKKEMTPLDVALMYHAKKATITLLEAGAELPVRIKIYPKTP